MDDIVDNFIRLNTDLNSENELGQTALHIACSKGNDCIVENLLACGRIDINKQSDNGYTALHFACCNGHGNVIEILLDNGAAINIRSYLDETIVDVASKRHAKVIDILLNRNMEDILDQLLEHSSTFLKAYTSSFSIQRILRQHLVLEDPNSYVNKTEFSLHYACWVSDNELIDQLLENPKVDVDCISKFGVTPLLICISNQDLRNTKIIIESGASVNKMTHIYKEGVLQLFGHTTASFIKDLTPFSFACFVQNCELIQILIDQNAEIYSPIHISYDNPDNYTECEILTPLCVSIMQNNVYIVKLLVNNASDTVSTDVNYIMMGSLYDNINVTEEQCLNLGRLELTSFQVACIIGNTAIAPFLIQNNLANVNNTFMISPILLSSYFKCEDMLIKIMSKNKIENKMFQTEVTPLILSALVENKKMMKLLLQNHANPECNVSLSLLHVIALNKDILNIFGGVDSCQDFTLECTINALFICCLKDNTEMSNILLQNQARTTSCFEITALHVVCFRGLLDHLNLIFLYDCYMSRRFSIQSYHFLTMNSNEKTIAMVPWYINSTNTFNLGVTLTELSCLIKDSALFAFLLKHMYYDDEVMELTPLFLSLFVGVKKYIIRTEIPVSSDLSLCSIISSTFIVFWTWMTHGLLSNTSLLTILDDLHEKQHIKDTSLICLASFHTNAFDKDLACKLEFSSLLNETFEVRLCQIIHIDNLFLRIKNKETMNELVLHSAVSNTNVKINMIYLTLLKNELLQYLLVNSYSDIALDLLQFTHLEISYLVHQKLPQSLLNIKKTTEEKATVSQLLIACLHQNISNVKFLCYKGKTIQNNSMSVFDLAAFFYRKNMFCLDLQIVESIEHKDANVTFDELLIACLLGSKQIIKYLLHITIDVNARSCISPLQISIIRKESLIPFATDFLATVEDSKGGLDLDFISSNLCLPIEVNVVHLICFLHDVEILRILIQMKCDLHAITRVSTLFLYCLKMRHFYILRNIFNAVSEMRPLHIACILNKKEFVQCILTNTNYINELCSIHPLHLDTAYSEDISKSVKEEYFFNTAYSELITEKSSFTITALHAAILCQKTEIAKTLITNNANTELTAKLFIEICIGTDTLFCTQSTLKPLHLACLVENEDIFRIILANTSIHNLNEKVDMSYCHLGYLNLQERVFLYGTLGCEIEMRLNILHTACILGKISYVELLLNANVASDLGVEIVPIHSSFENEFSVKKYPLHLSAEKGDLDLCKLLLDHGANIDIKTNVLGLQPWHLALYNGYEDVMKFLLTHRRILFIDRSRFMFIFMLYIMRKRFSRVILPFIAKSSKFLINLSVYRYLRCVLSFPVNNNCGYTTDEDCDEYNSYDDSDEYDEYDKYDEDKVYNENNKLDSYPLYPECDETDEELYDDGDDLLCDWSSTFTTSSEEES